MVKKVKKNIKKSFKINRNHIISLIVILIIIIGFYVAYKKEVLFNPEDEYMMESDMDYVEEDSHMASEDTYVNEEEDDSFFGGIIDAIMGYWFDGDDSDMMIEECENYVDFSDITDEISDIEEEFYEIEMSLYFEDFEEMEELFPDDDYNTGITGNAVNNYDKYKIESDINNYIKGIHRKIFKNDLILTSLNDIGESEESTDQALSLVMMSLHQLCDEGADVTATAKLIIAGVKMANLYVTFNNLLTDIENDNQALESYITDLQSIIDDLLWEVITPEEAYSNAIQVAENVKIIYDHDIKQRLEEAKESSGEIRELLSEAEEIILSADNCCDQD